MVCDDGINFRKLLKATGKGGLQSISDISLEFPNGLTLQELSCGWHSCLQGPANQERKMALASNKILLEPDDRVRVVTMTTRIKSYTRTFSKLALLYESSLTPAREDVLASLKLVP